MAGMGPDESQRMLAWLQSIKGQFTLLLVEHDMDAVFALADTVSVLVAGPNGGWFSAGWDGRVRRWAEGAAF